MIKIKKTKGVFQRCTFDDHTKSHENATIAFLWAYH